MKAVKRQGARLSVRVSEEAYQRLFVASVMGKVTASEILDRLIRDHCREWSLPGKLSDKSHRANPSPEISCNAPQAAHQDAA